MKKRTSWLVLFITLLFLFFNLNNHYLPQSAKLDFKKGIYDLNLVAVEKYKVKYVIDGDTFVVDDGEHIRLLGINTPELHSQNKELKRMAYQAKEETKRLVANKIVYLTRDVRNRDKYGRLLRFVFLSADETKDIKKSVNYYLVRHGYAQVLTIPPNVAYEDNFLAAQAKARQEKLGLWRLK